MTEEAFIALCYMLAAIIFFRRDFVTATCRAITDFVSRFGTS